MVRTVYTWISRQIGSDFTPEIRAQTFGKLELTVHTHLGRTMGKSMEHHSVQILNISRFQQKLRAEEALAKLSQGMRRLSSVNHFPLYLR